MSNLLPSLRYVFDRKNQATDYRRMSENRVKGLVQLEVMYKRERKYVGTGIKVYKGQWSELSYVINHPNSVDLNVELNRLMARANAIVSDMTRDESEFSVARFMNIVKSNGGNNGSMLVEDVIEEKKESLEADGCSTSTRKAYNALRSRLREYGKIKYMRDICLETIVDFEKSLTARRLYQSTITQYLAKLEALVSFDMSKHRTERNPFEDYKPVRKRRKKTIGKNRFLTDDELKAIESYVPKNRTYEKARDIFLLGRYTGMSHCDLVKLNLYRDFELEDGKYILRSDRTKTGVGFTVVLLQPAVDIMKKYDGMVPLKDLPHTNKLLKEIGMNVIGRPITTHDARHSFATWALRSGVRIETVSRILGHSSIRQTQRYAKILAEDVVASFGELEKKVSSDAANISVVNDRCVIRESEAALYI